MGKILPRILPRILPIVAILVLPSVPAFAQFVGQTLSQPSPPLSQKKAPAAERAMKTCQEYGAGYVRVEGTGTCVKIGGYVRAQGSVR